MLADPGPTEREALGQAPTLGERPEDDELEVGVAEARIKAALFGVQQQVAIGRYRLLELVGRGGMGVVWGAWDPELQRKVAVKLVDSRSGSQDRIVAEARALAKVSHPNVVPIYDVGVVEDRVYLVMEWVVGKTLRNYLGEPRAAREIADLYAQAARGLAAVHAANLVHRDFKPDNAMVGSDRRVRVLDFGLAWGDAENAQRGQIAGTPRYMAPEQRAGEPPTAAVDQYAWCISLREALDGLPLKQRTAWLDAICERGTSAEPADRFASMDELLQALGRDPAKLWRRRILVGTLVATTASAFVVGRSRVSEPCTEFRDDLVFAAERPRLTDHLDRLGGFPAAERPSVLARLDLHQRNLVAAHRAACVAHDRGALTTGLYERRLTCFARVRASIVATTEVLVRSTAATFPDARIAVSSLADANACAQVDELIVAPPPPTQIPAVRAAEMAIERARVLTTGARPEAVATAVQARTDAERTAYLPVIARALLVEGRARMWADDPGATPTLERAMRSGIAAQDDATTVEAFARMAYDTAVRDSRVVDGATVIDAIAQRLRAGSFARLLLLNNLAAAQIATSNTPTTAQQLLEAAIRERSTSASTSEADYELVSIRQNLALVVDDPQRSLELLSQARSDAIRAVGANHPKVLEIEQAQALFVSADRAKALVEGACERLEQLFAALPDKLADCKYNAAWFADEAGDRARAAKLFAAAQLDPVNEASRLQIATAMATLDSRSADPIVLARRMETLGATVATSQEWWSTTIAADAFMAAARSWQAVDDRVAERQNWDRARRALEAILRPTLHSQLAHVHAALARIADRDAARRFATRALAWYRRVGPPDIIRELDQIARK